MPVHQPTYEDSLRAISDALALARLCNRAACRRAKSCKGPPRQCIEKCAPIVPEAARRFVVDVLADKAAGYTPEEAVRDHPQEAEAFFAWRVAAGAHK